MSPARRDDYAAVGRAIRAGRARIMAAENPPDSALRVWAATLDVLASWSRLDDTVARDRLAEMAGLSPRTTTWAIRWLVDNGVVEWTPGSRGRHSRLSIRHLVSEQPALPPIEGDSEQSRLPANGQIASNPGCSQSVELEATGRPIGGNRATDSRQSRLLTPEDVPEDSSRERVPNTPDTTPTEEDGIDEERILADTLDHMARMDLDYATHEGAVIHSPARWLATARQNLDRIHGTDIIRLAHGTTDPHPVDIAANIDYRYMTPERRRHHDDTRTARQRAEDAERRAGSQAFIAWRTDADQRIAAADPHDIERAVAHLELDPALPAPDRHQLRTWAMANLPQPEGATA